MALCAKIRSVERTGLEDRDIPTQAKTGLEWATCLSPSIVLRQAMIACRVPLVM
jgi:hypothetical protein